MTSTNGNARRDPGCGSRLSRTRVRVTRSSLTPAAEARRQLPHRRVGLRVELLEAVDEPQILAALAAFTPGPDPEAERTARQRRADAFTDICTTALASKTRGGDGADTPYITLTVSWETLHATLTEQQPPADRADHESTKDKSSPEDETSPEDDADPGDQADTGADGTTSADATTDPDGTPDPDGTTGTQTWPRWLGPPLTPPTPGHGETDRIHDMLAELGDQLRPGGPALLGHPGEPICAETARRLACDAGIIPVLLGSRSQPLDIGRLTRVVPTALRRAVELRDRTCRFPACDRPPNWCDCHHLQHWTHGGATCLTNLILLCRFHHSLVHEYGWRLHLDPHTLDVSATRPDGSAYDLISRHDRLTSPRDGPSP